jgi:hypothetical protein
MSQCDFCHDRSGMPWRSRTYMSCQPCHALINRHDLQIPRYIGIGMARPDTSDVAAPSTEHRQADMVATLSRNAWHGITEAEQKRRTVAAGKAHADDKAEMQERRLGRKLTFVEKLRLQYVATLAENTAATEAEQAAAEQEAELFGADAEMLAQFRQNDLLVARESRRKARAEGTSPVITGGCDDLLFPQEVKEDNAHYKRQFRLNWVLKQSR